MNDRKPNETVAMNPADRGDINRFLANADAVCALMMLPAVTTNDWTSRAAEAVARLHPGPSRACVMLVAGEVSGTEDGSFRIESVGVCAGEGNGQDSAGSDEGLTMRVRLERVRNFGFARTPLMMQDGFVGRMSGLSRSWRETSLGRVWAGVPAGEVLIGVCPIEGVPGSMVVCMYAGDAHTPECSLQAFGAVMAVLTKQTAMMYRSMGCTDGVLRWLTAREQDVLDALVDGLSVREIADRLGRSRHTMHDHVKNLHKKLNASCRGELVAAALGHSECGKRCSLRMPMVIEAPSDPIQELKPSPMVRSNERSE
ncbi:MAG: helix-turn-helix transcriptional regulator [Phycisphaerales bacterium]|nr:helix-turn-helix transcriptional regulator [Phycisphaerales bacterium]